MTTCTEPRIVPGEAATVDPVLLGRWVLAPVSVAATNRRLTVEFDEEVADARRRARQLEPGPAAGIRRFGNHPLQHHGR